MEYVLDRRTHAAFTYRDKTFGDCSFQVRVLGKIRREDRPQTEKRCNVSGSGSQRSRLQQVV